MSRWALRVGAGLAGVVLAVAVAPAPVHSPQRARLADVPTHTRSPAMAHRPLAGITIALDPGHQLGNHNFPAKLNRLVPAGGFRKPCNTTGTATNAGVPEATVVWRVVRAVRTRLVNLGATVRLTRHGNGQHRLGPCVNVRGRFGGRVGARLTVSVHADGAPAADHGFHVIAPARRRPWTTHTARPSLRLAKALRRGLDDHRFRRSNYIGGGSALSIRSDLATLNLSSVPVAMIEIGNMRNAHDARTMTHRPGQLRYAAAIVEGVRRFLHR